MIVVRLLAWGVAGAAIYGLIVWHLRRWVDRWPTMSREAWIRVVNDGGRK